MITATEVIENCLLWLRDPHQDWHKTDMMLRYLNRALRHIARKSQSITSHAFLPVLKDIFRYPLPDDFLHALIVGFDPSPNGEWYELEFRMDKTVDRVARSRYRVGEYPTIYSVAGRSVIDRYHGYVHSTTDTDNGFTLRSGSDEDSARAPQILFHSIFKPDDRLLNVTDGSEAAITTVDLEHETLYYQILSGGADNELVVDDEVRIVSPQESRHTLNIAPKPRKDSAIGKEQLSLFYAREHPVIIAQNLTNENDTLELDLEFETALEHLVCYYGSIAQHGRNDRGTEIFKADYESEYDDAFPAVNKRVREAASLWEHGVSSGVITQEITNIPDLSSPYNRVI